MCLHRSFEKNFKPFVLLCTLVTLYRAHIEPYFDFCSPLWDTCGKQLKDKLQKIQNRAGRVITGSSYDVRSVDVLNNLKWKTLETRRFHTKAALMYKILNDLSAPAPGNSFVKLSDNNINYNIRNIEADLALPRPYTNFLKRSFLFFLSSRLSSFCDFFYYPKEGGRGPQCPQAPLLDPPLFLISS